MKWYRVIIDELSASTNPRSWYLYGAFHMAHMLIGMVSVALVSFSWQYTFNEFPQKVYMSLFIGVVWAAYEWLTQKKQDPWGNFEDWMFIYLYGALPLILLFTEVKVGSPFLSINIDYAGPVYGVAFGHLFIGIFCRVWREVVK